MGMDTPVVNRAPIFIMKSVNPPTNTIFATTHESINDEYRVMIGNLARNGEYRAIPITNLRYWKKKGIVIKARAGKHGPPKTFSMID